MHETVMVAVLAFSGGLFVGHFVLKTRRRYGVIQVGDPDPAKRCPKCEGTGRRLSAVAAFNCDECGARAGGHHAGDCHRQRDNAAPEKP